MANVPTQEVLNLKQKGLSEDEIYASLQRKGYPADSIHDAMTQGEVKQGVESTPSIPQNETASEQMQTSAMDQIPARGQEVQSQMPQPSGQAGENVPVPIPVTASKAYEGSQPQEIPQQAQVFPQEPRATPMPQPVIPPQQGLDNRSMEEVQSLVEEVIEEKWRDLLSSFGDIASWKNQVTQDNEAMKQEILRLREAFEKLQNAVVGKVQEYSQNIKDVNSEMQALEQVFQKILEPLTTNIKDLNKITEELKRRK